MIVMAYYKGGRVAVFKTPLSTTVAEMMRQIETYGWGRPMRMSLEVAA